MVARTEGGSDATSAMPSEPRRLGRPAEAGRLFGAICASRSSLSPILLDRPGRIDDRAVGAHEQRQLAPARTLAHDRLHAADATERPWYAGEQPVGGEQILDRSVEPHAAIARAGRRARRSLDVAPAARGDDDGRAGLGRRPPSGAAGSRGSPRGSSRAQRLVEQEQRGALAEGERQRECARSPGESAEDARLRRRAARAVASRVRCPSARS